MKKVTPYKPTFNRESESRESLSSQENLTSDHQVSNSEQSNANPQRTCVEMYSESSNSQLNTKKMTKDEFESQSGDPRTMIFIDEWQHGVIKHFFAEAFDGKIDFKEFFLIVLLLGMMFVNVGSMAINVYNLHSKSFEVITLKYFTYSMFYFEFGTVLFFFLIFIAVIIYSFILGDFGTNFVVDLVDVAQIVSSFSVLQVLSRVAPAATFTKLFNMWNQCVSIWNYCLFIIALLLWIIGIAVAFVACVVKCSQVSYTASVSINNWTFWQWILLLGLVNNLTRINKSIETEVYVLLQTIHTHFIGPGGPISINPSQEGFYSKLLRFLRIQRQHSYEIFESVFDAFVCEKEGDTNASRKHNTLCDALNFMAFLLKINNVTLRQVLQMTYSPLPLYASNKKKFLNALKNDDEQSLKEALEDANPLARSTLKEGIKDPLSFQLIYVVSDPQNVKAD